jgi:hypothetical protein
VKRSTLCKAAKQSARLLSAFILVAVLCIGTSALGVEKKSAAVGDIAKDPDIATSYPIQSATAGLIVNHNPVKVFTLGDTQYADGDYADYLCTGGATSGCGSYDDNENQSTVGPAYGDFLTDTIEVIGNHEYYKDTNPGANECCDEGQGFRDYFNRETTGTFPEDPISYSGTFNTSGVGGDPSLDTRFYVVDSMVCVQSESSCQDTGTQYEELETAIATNTATDCVVAAWHHPLFTNGDDHDPGETEMHDIYDLLDDEAGVDLILVGHSHWYEKFPRQSADNNRNSSSPRVFIVGTGGQSPTSEDSSPNDNHSPGWDRDTVGNDDQDAQESDNGILKLWFNTSTYKAEFVNENGTTLDAEETYQCSNDPLP